MKLSILHVNNYQGWNLERLHAVYSVECFFLLLHCVHFMMESLILFYFFVQGGPHNHTIGGLAVCLKLAAAPEFKVYQQQV